MSTCACLLVHLPCCPNLQLIQRFLIILHGLDLYAGLPNFPMMVTLDLRNLSNPSPTYSFQNARSSFLTTQVLYWEGCKLDTPWNATRNCTAACQAPGLLFQSPLTIQNCMVLSQLGPSIQLTNVAREVVQYYSVDPDDAALSSNIINTLQQCFTQYCTANPQDCDATPYHYSSPRYPTLLNYHGAVCSRHVEQLCFENVCSNIEAPLNSDIGGIGVYKSYIMQTGIALLAFIFLKMFDGWIYYTIVFLYYIFWPLGCFFPFGLSRVKQKVRAVQERTTRYLPPLKSALVEFQKAQCFFMLAIEIAAQVVVAQDSMGSTTLQGIYNNYSLIGNISIGGFLPITFTLLCLFRSGMKSWFLLILSTCTVAVSAVTLYTTGNFNPSAKHIEILRTASSNYTDCGSLNPATYCLESDRVLDTTSFNFGGGAMLLFSLLVLGLLFLDLSRFYALPFPMRFTSRLSKGLDVCLQRAQNEKGRMSTMIQKLGIDTAAKCEATITNLMYLIIWIWYIFWIWIYLQTLIDLRGNGATFTLNDWSFGQIVAVTIWAAPLTEYLKLSFQGLQAGLDYRTPESFEIVDRALDKPEYQLKRTHPISQDEQLLWIDNLNAPIMSTLPKAVNLEDAPR